MSNISSISSVQPVSNSETSTYNRDQVNFETELENALSKKFQETELLKTVETEDNYLMYYPTAILFFPQYAKKCLYIPSEEIIKLYEISNGPLGQEYRIFDSLV